VAGRWFRPGDDIPDEYASQLGDHVWTDDGQPAPTDAAPTGDGQPAPTGPTPPPATTASTPPLRARDAADPAQ
jgi:hypothetical protein